MEEILKEYLEDSRLSKIYNGSISLPYVDDSYQPYGEVWVPYPPALVPVFIDYSSKIIRGYLHHVNKDINQSLWVNFDYEANCFYEECRTVNQLISKMVLDMNMIADGNNDKIMSFCSELGFDVSEQINAHADLYGDVSSDMDKLIHFNTSTPLKYVSDINIYDGHFPSNYQAIITEKLDQVCSFEIMNKDYLRGFDNVPTWHVSGSNKNDLFRSFFEEGQLFKAWLTLNSEGWKLNELCEALIEFVDASDDSLLKKRAVRWVKECQGFIKNNSLDSARL